VTQLPLSAQEKSFLNAEGGPAETGKSLRYGLIALIFFATALNYVDRQVLALLKPMLEAQFGWSDQDFAHLGSSFQISAALALLGVG
jgi:ACS family hexuronate transporter-like MFS transporter